MNQQKTHIVACGCSARIPVARGQAGGQVPCPACGAVVEVPRLRDFALLDQVTDASRPRQRWDATRGTILAAVAVAALAGCAALAVGPLAAGLQVAPPAPRAIRDAVASASIVDVHRAWQRLQGQSVDRSATENERRLQAIAASSAVVARGLWGVAGLAALVAIVAAASRPTGAPR